MILVTGATGFVGGHIVKKLRGRGLSTRCLVRRPERAGKLRAIGCEVIKGGVLCPASIRAALEGVEEVIHLVGIIVEVGGATFEAMHYQATKNMVDSCREARIRRYLHMSALGTGPEAKSLYHRTKWRAEEYVRSSGLDFSIFRPSLIFGEGDQFFTQLAKMIRFAPFVPVIGPGRNLLQPISVDDVAECFVQALGKPDTIGKTYNLGGPEKLSFDAILDTIGEVVNKKRPKFHIPFPAANLVASLLEKIAPKPPLTRDQLLMIQADNICDMEEAKKDFKLPLTTLAQGLRSYLLKG